MKDGGAIALENSGSGTVESGAWIGWDWAREMMATLQPASQQVLWNIYQVPGMEFRARITEVTSTFALQELPVQKGVRIVSEFTACWDMLDTDGTEEDGDTWILSQSRGARGRGGGWPGSAVPMPGARFLWAGHSSLPPHL